MGGASAGFQTTELIEAVSEGEISHDNHMIIKVSHVILRTQRSSHGKRLAEVMLARLDWAETSGTQSSHLGLAARTITPRFRHYMGKGEGREGKEEGGEERWREGR